MFLKINTFVNLFSGDKNKFDDLGRLFLARRNGNALLGHRPPPPDGADLSRSAKCAKPRHILKRPPSSPCHRFQGLSNHSIGGIHTAEAQVCANAVRWRRHSLLAPVNNLRSFVNLFSGDKNKFVFTARRAAAL